MPANRPNTKILVDGGDPSVPGPDFSYEANAPDGRPLKPLPYKSLNLDQPWENFDLAHELTTKGIREFVEDYQSTLKKIA